jgi:hypothetical protein
VTLHVINPVKGPFARSRSWLPGKGSALISGLKAASRCDEGHRRLDQGRTVVDPVVGAVKRHFGINSRRPCVHEHRRPPGLRPDQGHVQDASRGHREEGLRQPAEGLGAFIVKKGLVSSRIPARKALKALGGLGGDVLGLLGLGGGGGGSSANQKIGDVLAAARGWSGPQWAA